MFLWQKFKYSLEFLNTLEDFEKIREDIKKEEPKIIGFDTETTGLDFFKDVPFLVGIGFAKRLYVYEPSIEKNDFLYKILKESPPHYFLAHNAKYDYHMMRNFGSPIPDFINIGDTLALARITEYVDNLSSMSLENLGISLVNPESKFAGKVIKEHLNLINKERYKLIKQYVKDNIKDISYTNFKDNFYDKYVPYVNFPYEEHILKIQQIAPKANYYDSYVEKPNLMINYLADDIVLVLEVYKALESILDVVDHNRTTWHRENQLIRTVGDFEINGLRADINYLVNSRYSVKNYIDDTYKKLHNLVGKEFKVGQHAVIKKIFATQYKIAMTKTDDDALNEIIKYYEGDAVKVATYISELRTLDKWMSTYIEGMLKRVYQGRVYTDINNSGTNTGRVSSDLQQQPQGALKDREGVELFHPRKIFINDEGHTNFYIDFSNMELRVQAYYTLLTSDGDTAMCQAFMPFKCVNSITGEYFSPRKDVKEWNSNVWVYEDGTPWTKTDLHSETTMKAFPKISKDDPLFKTYYRELGKRANFLKVYGGGSNTLMNALKIDEDTAKALSNGFYEAFPKVRDYQKWVERQILSYGFVTNLLGRRYYFNDTSFAYKGYNYLIQGSCADYVKLKEIELSQFLSKYKSKILMPVHDEIIFSIKQGEEHIIPELKRIMEDVEVMMPWLPMVAEVSISHTNWAEKEKYNANR
jgi:DNA polymerase I-like protein with 3'-5' exonuclease and polymerase domains